MIWLPLQKDPSSCCVEDRSRGREAHYSLWSLPRWATRVLLPGGLRGGGPTRPDCSVLLLYQSVHWGWESVPASWQCQNRQDIQDERQQPDEDGDWVISPTAIGSLILQDLLGVQRVKLIPTLPRVSTDPHVTDSPAGPPPLQVPVGMPRTPQLQIQGFPEPLPLGSIIH